MTTTTRALPVSSKFTLEDQERRKTRLMDILSRGLPTLPNYVLDLNVLLSQTPVELKKVGNVIRTDASLTSQVLRLCNSALFGLRHRVISIEQAAILLGSERLRTLVLTCSVMQFAGKHLPKEQLTLFWEHSFLCALLSERLASHLHYCEKEQAYLGGLLHDIGQLPMWILVVGEAAANRIPPPPDWTDNVALERDYFGMDHCKVGRWMGVSWNYMPSFVDVFQYHHAPSRAQHDPYLVGLIATADRFLITHAEDNARVNVLGNAGPAVPAAVAPRNAALDAAAPRAANPNATRYPKSSVSGHSPRNVAADTFAVKRSPAVDSGQPSPVVDPNLQQLPSFLQECLPALAESEHRTVLNMMETEYLQLVPLVQLGISAATSEDA
jgi:HD-like signal output (HDOD) protein